MWGAIQFLRSRFQRRAPPAGITWAFTGEVWSLGRCSQERDEVRVGWKYLSAGERLDCRTELSHDEFPEASQIPQMGKFESRCCTAKFAGKYFSWKLMLPEPGLSWLAGSSQEYSGTSFLLTATGFGRWKKSVLHAHGSRGLAVNSEAKLLRSRVVKYLDMFWHSYTKYVWNTDVTYS